VGGGGTFLCGSFGGIGILIHWL